MDAAGRLAELLMQPDVPLDNACAVIASVAPEPPTEAHVVEQLDRLAEGVPPGCSTDEVIDHLFTTVGFRGNTTHYYDPENSFIHQVLDRRLGIPITLAVVAVEVGRRCDVELSPVGLPAHFLIGDGSKPDRWFDPFAGGRPLDVEQCRSILGAIVPDVVFHRSMLNPIPGAAVVARILQNLRVAFTHHGDVARLAAVLDLRAGLPSATADDRLDLAKVLAAIGRFDQAAMQRELLAEQVPDEADVHLTEARRLRTRRN